MSNFMTWACPAHAREVTVRYDGSDGDLFRFSVSSLSRPLTHKVFVRFTPKAVDMSDPERLLQSGAVQVWSDDEFWTFGGCNYNCTVFGSALYPSFISPKSDAHDYVCSHTAYAVLSLICKKGVPYFTDGVDSFSVVCRWDGRDYV